MNIPDTLDQRGNRQGGDLRGLAVRDPAHLLNLSGCANPHGPHPAVLPAVATITGAELRDHPFTAVPDFLDAYADFLEVRAEHLMPLRGITEGLRTIARLHPTACVVCPDYTESIRLFRHVHGSFFDTPEVRAERVATAMATHRGSAVVLSNPCNPLGLHIPPRRLADTAAAYPATLLVVDEAYADFLPNTDTLLGVELDNVAVLRAPNKPMGIAGVRAGAIWTRNPGLHAAFMDELLTWPMGMFDAVAAIAALSEPGWLHRTRGELLTVAAWMGRRLDDLFGADVHPAPVHFRFVRRDRRQLDQLWTHLGEHRISVRVFPHGQPGRIPGMRIVAPTVADWPRLEHALAAFTP